ncbi:MAG TPA: hypothetical protein VNO79_11435 [Actinomycetota bacterium]|nr:hypothetical protein [Actinomycetota bacterium]
MPGPGTLARRAAYAVMALLAPRPLALVGARLVGHGVVADPGTDLVVEGFPRSGNSLAVAAIAAAQPGPIRIAHHTHAPANVLRALALGLPTLLVIRDPDEAALELVLAKPFLSLRGALLGYARFHEPLLAHRDRFVVATFEQVHGDLAGVVRRLNARFGTSFAEPGAEALRAAEGRIAAQWAGRRGPGLPFVGRASPPRGAPPPLAGGTAGPPARGRLLADLSSPALAPTRARARRSFLALLPEG